ncbi:hypothetical protein [Pseudonocardia sp.]|uniref:hypothetical protein n=1 Tax=Pseudonocardia sp. TaxID=60912 RepID=UPI003D0C09A1
MKRYAPLLTLVAVVILGAALFTLSSINNPANQAAEQAQAAAPPPPAEAAPPAPAVEPPVVVEKAYAGRSADRRMTIAIAVKDGKAIAYVCDGKKIEAWLDGTLQGDTLALTGKDGASVTGIANEQSSEGEIVVAGKTWKYTAKGVEAPAGLYEGRADVRGVATRIGWVVEPDGQVTGIQQAAGETSPAPPLNPADPADVTIDGVTVTVTSLDGSTPVVTR